MRKAPYLICVSDRYFIKYESNKGEIAIKLNNKWIHGDCLQELKKMPDESVDLIITSPPYHNLRVYSNDPCDLSNCETYEEYYYLLDLVIKECERVLKPGCKFVMQFEDYNYTIGRDGKNGQESLTGEINNIFLRNNFTLFTKAIWRKYSAQRAMLAQGNLYYRNMKARDAILAANFGFVYVYKKAGDCEVIKASDITLAEWATWADGVWDIPNSGIGHTTPFAEDMVKRCIKLWSCPGDTVLDIFAGAGTVNKVAIENHRNAIGIELNQEFYDLAIEKRFSKWTDFDLCPDDSIEKMKDRYAEQLQIGKEQSAKAKAEREAKKAERQSKKQAKQAENTEETVD